MISYSVSHVGSNYIRIYVNKSNDYISKFPWAELSLTYQHDYYKINSSQERENGIGQQLLSVRCGRSAPGEINFSNLYAIFLYYFILHEYLNTN